MTLSRQTRANQLAVHEGWGSLHECPPAAYAYYMDRAARELNEQTGQTMDYRALRLWHSDSGAFPHHVQAWLERARKDKAPQDVLYRGSEGWVTVRDLKPDHPFRERLEGAHDTGARIV